MDQPWIFCAKLPEFLGIRWSAKDNCRGGVEGPEDAREFSVSNRTYHYQVTSRRLLFLPQITGQDRDHRSLALRLPASRQQARKFGFVGEYDYVGVSQREPAPGKYFR